MQDFLKRLRKRSTEKFKVFYCGEYGQKAIRPVGPFNPRKFIEDGQRPHYHACLLGRDFPDQELYTVRDGYRLYSSDFLADVWGHGFVSIGALTFESAAYVARYCLKKVNGKLAQKPDPLTGLLPYERCHPITGEIVEVTPEFAHMSRGGRSGRGIGYAHVTDFTSDIYPHDYVIHKGREMKPARYYDTIYDEINPESMEEIKARRAEAAELHAWNSTPSRLKVRETVKKAQLTQLVRGTPNECT